MNRYTYTVKQVIEWQVEVIAADSFAADSEISQLDIREFGTPSAEYVEFNEPTIQPLDFDHPLAEVW